MELHVAMSVKHKDPGTVELMPLARLFAEAGRGWCAQAHGCTLHA